MKGEAEYVRYVVDLQKQYATSQSVWNVNGYLNELNDLYPSSHWIEDLIWFPKKKRERKKEKL